MAFSSLHSIGGVARTRFISVSTTALFILGVFVSVAMLSKDASAATITVCASGCDYTSLQTAINNASNNDTISVESDLSISSRINITKPLTLAGNGHTLTPTFSYPSGGSSNNAVIGISSTNSVTIQDLTIIGVTSNNLIGINIYKSTGVSLINNTIKNNGKYGVIVNGSIVSISNHRSSGNLWGGINVDQGGGVTDPASLIIEGTPSQINDVPPIKLDKPGNADITVVDETGEYVETAPGIYTLPPDTSTTSFVNSPKYVRANNPSDIGAQVVTPDATTGVRFIVDGNTSAPINGVNVGGAGATTSWWRLITPLSAGEHTITAQINHLGGWFDVPGTSGTVYSLDTPWAQYVIPQSNKFFRPNDKVVRIKADDEFNQFKHMVVEIGGISTTVNRSECSDQGNYVFCDVQNLNLAEGTYTAKTTTYTLANNRADNVISPLFTIDSTRPAVSNFKINNPKTAYSSLVEVSADATDSNGIKTVEFYVTAPRLSDGVCDGNGTKLMSTFGSLSSGSTYISTLDTSELNGTYCLNVIAGDNAANHSTPVAKIKAVFDNTAPIVSIDSYSTNTNIITPAVTATDPAPGTTLSYKWTANNASSSNNVTISDNETLEPSFTALVSGDYSFSLAVTDQAGNETVRTFGFTYTAPVITAFTGNAPAPANPAPNPDGGANPDGNTDNTGANNDGFANVVGDNADGNGVVLGANTDTPNAAGNTDDSDGEVKGASIDKEKTAENASKFLGLGVWWIPLIIASLGIIYWVVVKRADSTSSSS